MKFDLDGSTPTDHDLDKMISENQLLDSEQKSELLKLLKKFEHLFDGTL